MFKPMEQYNIMIKSINIFTNIVCFKFVLALNFK